MANPYQLVSSGYMDIAGDDDLEAMSGAEADLMALSGGMYSIMGDVPAPVLDQSAILAQHLARNSVAVRQSEPNKWRETTIGFGPIDIPAGTSVDVITQPQVVFRGERLQIPSDIAGQISVEDVKVGKNSQFAASNPIPGRSFDERSVGGRLRMDTAQISQQIVLRIRNTGGAPVSFTAALVGTSIEL